MQESFAMFYYIYNIGLLSNMMQLILEGMGRSLHTNLNARFKCDALKVLVSANLTHWLLHWQP